MKQFIDDKQDEAFIPIAPLIDVVFLLLIFFFCVTSFSRIETEMNVNLPSSRSGAKSEVTPVQVIVSIDVDGAVFVDDKQVGMADLKELLLTKYQGDDTELVIRGDKEAKHGKVVQVLDLCIDAGINKVVIRTKKTLEE